MKESTRSLILVSLVPAMFRPWYAVPTRELLALALPKILGKVEEIVSFGVDFRKGVL